MRLEDSDGKIFNPVSEDELSAVIDKVGGALDFCTLSNGDGFIQTAGSSGGLLIQYRDSSGQYESDDTSLSSGAVKDIFSAYLKGDESWKNGISFSKWSEDDGQAEDSDSNARLNSGPKDFSPESIKKTVVNAVKGEATRSISSMVRRLIRNIFR